MCWHEEGNILLRTGDGQILEVREDTLLLSPTLSRKRSVSGDSVTEGISRQNIYRFLTSIFVGSLSLLLSVFSDDP